MTYDCSRKQGQTQPQVISQEVKFKVYWSTIICWCCRDWLDVELYVCVHVVNKINNKPALEDALELTSNNLPQDLSKIKQ